MAIVDNGIFNTDKAATGLVAIVITEIAGIVAIGIIILEL